MSLDRRRAGCPAIIPATQHSAQKVTADSSVAFRFTYHTTSYGPDAAREVFFRVRHEHSSPCRAVRHGISLFLTFTS